MLDRMSTEDLEAFEAGDYASMSTEGLRTIEQYSAASAEPAGPSAMGFFNRGLAQSLGAPVDIVTAGLEASGIAAGLEAIGLSMSDTQIGGSASFQELFEAMGADVADPEDRAESFGAQVAEGVGSAVGAILPMAGAAKVASTASHPVTQSIGREALETMARRPVAVPALELTAGAGAGAGGYTAEQIAPDSPAAKMAGQVVGGIAAPLAVSGATLPARMTKRAAQKTLAPFTKKGARIRAEERVKSLVPENERMAAAAALDEKTIADLTPAQKTGQRRLFQLEKEVLKDNVDLDDEFLKRSRANLKKLKGELAVTRGEGDVQDARAFIQERTERLSTALRTRTQQAVDKAEQRVSRLPAKQRQSQASVIAREELEKALQSARSQERELWKAVPDEVDVDFAATKGAFDDFLASTPKAQHDDIPAIAKKFLGKDGVLGRSVDTPPADPLARLGGRPVPKTKTSVDSLKQVQGLRSKLLEEARVARANSEFNKARISNNLADSLLEDMARSQGGDELQSALTFSRELNEKFTQGTVGRLLGSERLGGERIAPELTLGSSVGRGGTKGRVALNELSKAADTPELRSAVEDYLRGSFERSALRNGKIMPEAARRFVKENADLLDKYPTFQDEIIEAVSSADTAARVAARETGVTSALASAKKSRAGEFLNTTVEREFDTIAKSRNPRKMALNLKKMAARDKTGDSTAGLKAGAVDHLMKQSTVAGVDEAGDQLLSGRRMLNILNKKTKDYKAIKPFLNDDEVARLRQIAKELSKFEKVDPVDIGGIINDTPNALLTTLSRVGGAQIGGKYGASSAGGSLQTAQIFSGRARQMIDNLTNDRARKLLVQAVQDDKLMKALLTDTTTAQGRKLVNQRLNAWIAAIGAEEEQE